MTPLATEGKPEKRPWCDQAGIALLEVMITSVILGITFIGIAFALQMSQVFVVAQGDDQVALFLADQKIEKLRLRGFDGLLVAGPEATAKCAETDSAADDEPCFTEQLKAGSTVGTQQQTFTRRTCVDYVSNSGPPYPATCSPNPGSPTSTKRVQVTVTPAMLQADPVALDTVVIKLPEDVAP